VCRRPAAEKECVNFIRPAEPRQLALQCVQVRPDQIIPPGYQREVAIPAAVAAEGDVDIRCAGRDKSGRDGGMERRRDRETE